MFIGLAFTLCRLIFKSEVFLFWIGLAYIIPAIALFTQCLMSNEQLAFAAPFTSILYLVGSWLGGYAISLKLNTTFNHLLAFSLTIIGLFALVYFSYIDPQLWLRLLILNFVLGSIGLIVFPKILTQFPIYQSFDRWVLIFYILNVFYAFVRTGFNALFLDKIDLNHFRLTTSPWWLLSLSINILFNFLFAIVISASVIKKLIQQLNQERLRDPLTRLLNRRGFFEKSQQFNFYQQSYFIVCLDIDHFKMINDTWGHYIGDQVLQSVSQIMLQHIQPHDLIARFGGEEFVCLIAAQDATDAFIRTQKFKTSFEQLKFTPHQINITASYGLTQTNTFQELEHALKRADDLLYQAKIKGRNQIAFDLSL